VSERRLELPVLIVGAGPAGLMAAVALARHGIECLVVERRRELSTLPRATAISTRSMELLRSWI
jgi:putative polyketide hydroxylase